MQSVPQSLLVAHELASMTLEYRRECTPSDVVQSLSCPDTHLSSGSFKSGSPLLHGGLDGSPDAVSCSSGALKSASMSPIRTDPVQYTHLLRMQSTGADIVYGRTKWRVKDRYVSA
jgi:fatty acyl-ACP thioesterase B